MPTIVAIDGPAGVGKSTVSKRLARVLAIPHIDTGAMYRAVALKALQNGVEPADAEALERLASKSEIEFKLQDGQLRIWLDGRDITDEIRTPEVSMAASTMSAVPGVRRILVGKQQELGRRNGGVLEGRDIGTKVFPETPHKFFLTARPEIRAARRQKDLEAKGIHQPFDQVLAETIQRDHQDATRTDSPMTWDETYYLIDTSERTADEVVALIAERIQPPSTIAS
jgi:cytidylate kinase